MKKIYDNEWFESRLKETHPNDYKDYVLKSNYVNNSTKVQLLHKCCGKIIEITPASLFRGRGCRDCGISRRAKAQTMSKEKAQGELPESLHIIGNFHGAFHPVTVYCDKCHQTYTELYHNLTRVNYCRHCGNRYAESTERFKKEVNEWTHGEYSLVGEYTKANEYITIKHNLCGYIYKVTPHNFKHGERCPKCKRSHGEIAIESILIDCNIHYESPKIFDDLKNISYLHYDFYLPDKNILIEYQGEQHYKPVEHFGGIKKFNRQKYHDQLKRNYANRHGYKLLEIPYTMSDYNSIKSYIFNFIKENMGKPRV